MKDPHEMQNLCGDPASSATVEKLKEQLAQLKREARDDDRFADKQPAANE